MLLYYVFVLKFEWDLFQLFDDLNEFIIILVLFLWILMRSGWFWILQWYKCDGMILTIYEMTWYLFCVLPPYMRCVDLVWCYEYIWDYDVICCSVICTFEIVILAIA